MRFYTWLLLFLLFFALRSAAQDSVTVAASEKYDRLPLINWILVGKNYRHIWSLPVKMEVFHISKEQGGFTIKELGGGMQTKSLKINDKDSIEWSLRTIDKDVEKAVPKYLRKTPAQKVVQDMISSAHPYAPLSVAEMAKVLGLSAPQPKLFFVPDDPALGEFREVFANTICMLEKSEPTPDNSNAINTENLFEKLKEESDNVIDDTTLLKARLLDMLIADWDRHADQWKWGKKEVKGDDIYYPIPRDRDQAFFLSTGILVKIVRLFTLKHFVGFTDNTNKVTKLNKKAWEFDRILLSRLEADDWKRVIASFHQTLNDEVIKNALMKLPPEVYAENGDVLYKKLVKRRDGLVKDGMKYFRFLSEHALINGTGDDEVCRITGDQNTVVVTITQKKNNKLRYQRTFHAAETERIDIDLAGGNDVIEGGTDVSRKIKINLKKGSAE
jgi:hypothetical protein